MRLNQYSAFALCIIVFIGGVGLALFYPWLWFVPALAGALVVLGVVDLIQPRHSIRRNYPVLGHVRWGETVYSPIVPEGRVDYLVAFEQ